MISPDKIPSTKKIVSPMPDHFLSYLTIGKKYFAARAPGRNNDPMNNASRKLYSRLLSTIATRSMAVIQYDMIRNSLISNTNIAN